MRGTFALVVAAGVAAAFGWSLLRQSGEDAPARPATSADDASRLADPSPDVVQPAREPAARAAPPSAGSDASGSDPVAAARGILAADAGDLREDEARSRALRVAAQLLAQAERADTREGVQARMLARRLFAAVYDCGAATSAERDLAYQRSRELFDVLVRGNGAPAETVLRHRIEPGQSVWVLARGPWKQAGASVAPGFVLWLNGVADARRLRAGQVLKVPLEPLAVVVRKRSFELTVTLGGAPVERFTVAVGSDAKTPVGAFQAKDCLKNPDWYMNGRRIPFGSPEHIIGTRWIGLTGAAEADGIGIHGTNDDASIGTAASMGCIRMRNSEVERIFEWIAPGTRVEIRD
jgi:hypothetical protein